MSAILFGDYFMLTKERLKQSIHYDPRSGVFKRINRKTKNNSVGTVCAQGYRRIYVAGKIYSAHRLAFLYITGSFPKHEVDHINRVKLDNRWCNLRDVPTGINLKNKPKYKQNRSGHRGVRFNKHANKWVASICCDYKKIHLGYFDDLKDAVAARRKADDEFGFNT